MVAYLQGIQVGEELDETIKKYKKVIKSHVRISIHTAMGKNAGKSVSVKVWISGAQKSGMATKPRSVSTWKKYLSLTGKIDHTNDNANHLCRTHYRRFLEVKGEQSCSVCHSLDSCTWKLVCDLYNS